MTNDLLKALAFGDRPVSPAHFWAENHDGFCLVWCPDARGFASMVRFDVVNGYLPPFKIISDSYGVMQQIGLEPEAHLDWSRPYTALDICPRQPATGGDSPLTAMFVATASMVLFFWLPLLWLFLRWLK